MQANPDLPHFVSRLLEIRPGIEQGYDVRYAVNSPRLLAYIDSLQREENKKAAGEASKRERQQESAPLKVSKKKKAHVLTQLRQSGGPSKFQQFQHFILANKTVAKNLAEALLVTEIPKGGYFSI